jgi:hypothetical protein
MALFVKKFNKFMKMKRGQPRRGQTSRRNAFNDRKCFECGEPGHIAMNCPNKKKKGKDGDEKKKKKFYNKKKDGKAYLVEWDSDDSSDDDDDTSSKLNAGIAIKEAPSLFSSPHCLMENGYAKVKIITDLNDINDDDDVDDVDDDGYSYDDLVTMLGEADDYMHKEKEKFKTLKKLYENLQVSFEELNTSHNYLKGNCEKLAEAQNSSIVHEVVVVTEDVGVTCDLVDSPTSEPLPTNSIYDKCKISLINDNISLDESQIIVENEVLVDRVNALTHDLEKAYGGKAKLDFILGSQWCSLNREGLRYVPKKGKNAFIKQNTLFVKECDKVCHKCHKKGHIKKNCPKLKNVSSTCFEHCYVLSHNAKGVHAKFVGTSIVGNKKNAIWVPKTLVTNIQGPKQVWVPKRD